MNGTAESIKPDTCPYCGGPFGMTTGCSLPCDLWRMHRALITAYVKEMRELYERPPSTPIGYHKAVNYEDPVVIPMLLWCPHCGERHIDAGEFKLKLHHTHACQHCGATWRPAIELTVGVKFLPGFKDEDSV